MSGENLQECLCNILSPGCLEGDSFGTPGRQVDTGEHEMMSRLCSLKGPYQVMATFLKGTASTGTSIMGTLGA